MPTTTLRVRPRIEESKRWQTLEEVGRGTFTRVVKALDSEKKIVCALKVLRSAFRGDQELRARLVREGSSLARIHHPCVMPVIEVETWPEPFYAMPLLEGNLLSSYRKRGPAPAKALRVLGIDLADALGAIHAVGLVHRDLRPGNVFIVKGRPIVFDLGVAKDWGTTDRLTKAAFVARHPEYAAPETLRGAPARAAADLYALGAILLEFALGKHPFRGKDGIETTRNQIFRPAPRIEEERPDLPAAFSRLVAELVEKDPARRPESAWKVSHRVREALEV